MPHHRRKIRDSNSTVGYNLSLLRNLNRWIELSISRVPIFFIIVRFLLVFVFLILNVVLVLL
jgi:uncharacterized membrane protein YhdT